MEERVEADLAAKIDRVSDTLVRIERDHTPAVLANSMGAEDMVLTDLIARHAPEIAVFTLDTGRLNEETYALMQEMREVYPELAIETYFPDPAGVEAYTRQYGPNAFYTSQQRRKACCYIRKVEPLRRALADKAAWITGMRRQQSVTRSGLEPEGWDDDHGLYKFSPLFDWSLNEVWSYIREHSVPYNDLHDQGYASIGCAPCTRAIGAGEDERAGRWWWELPETKECGLHRQ